VTKAVLVGGPEDIRRDVEKHLRNLNIEVIDHWPYKRKMSNRIVPRAANLMLCLVDMLGHKDSDIARRAAKAAGVPYVFGTRKWSSTEPLVRAALSRIP
jgi:hypothetical protein